MIIGFDGSRAFEKHRTGTENYSYQLLKNLAKIDSENKYLVFLRPSNEVEEKSWPPNVEFKIIKFQRFWTQVGLALETFKTKMDVLFVPAHTLPIIRNPKLKTVITVHDLGVEYLPKMHQFKQQLYLKYFTNYQIKSATKIIAVSNATKDDLVNTIKIDQQKIKVVYEGVDREIFKPLDEHTIINIIKQFSAEFQNYFLFVGTIQPRKNLRRLIEGFSLFLKKKENKDSLTALFLAGSKGWMADDIYSLPKRLGIDNKVNFLGRISEKEMVALYNGAIAFAYPSLFEGFGLPVLEAFACNCPVLTSNKSSLKEIAGEAAYLVDPEDIQEIASGMEKLMDPKIRKELIKKGAHRIEVFSWEKCARETLDVLKYAYDKD